ncbi:unnamed protein product [Ilex paraguariensis]|uniref:Uncharacterized protein n=1 Tax=Ilex paraguariensis TaxID=185542 RepID=A0ABC8RZ44_9AQUA
MNDGQQWSSPTSSINSCRQQRLHYQQSLTASSLPAGTNDVRVCILIHEADKSTRDHYIISTEVGWHVHRDLKEESKDQMIGFEKKLALLAQLLLEKLVVHGLDVE